ncbi:MAG: biotin--[acetyl-CoA-carboxylase] ligase [Pseudomonadota bacterium]
MPDLPPGWTLHRHGTVASTNDLAVGLADQGASEGTIVLAEAQSAGRGRGGRSWVSPVGNLYCSVVLRPTDQMPQAANLSFVIAVALRAAIVSAIGPTGAQLKWPNDILINGAKVSGILLEAGRDSIIAGTGVNVVENMGQGSSPGATLIAHNPSATADALLHLYIAELDRRLQIWRREGFAPIRREWLDHGIGLGEPIVARTGQDTLEGVFETLDPNGALILRQPGGTTSTILAADVFFPAGAA